MYYDATHDVSVWLRTGSNPADSNRFQSHTGKLFQQSSKSGVLRDLVAKSVDYYLFTS